jgi:hypothetical protein
MVVISVRLEFMFMGKTFSARLAHIIQFEMYNSNMMFNIVRSHHARTSSPKTTSLGGWVGYGDAMSPQMGHYVRAIAFHERSASLPQTKHLDDNRECGRHRQLSWGPCNGGCPLIVGGVVTILFGIAQIVTIRQKCQGMTYGVRVGPCGESRRTFIWWHTICSCLKNKIKSEYKHSNGQ